MKKCFFFKYESEFSTIKEQLWIIKHEQENQEKFSYYTNGKVEIYTTKFTVLLTWTIKLC